MTQPKTTKTTLRVKALPSNSSAFDSALRYALLGVVALTVVLVAAVARAQSPEVGGVGKYTAEKTVGDYTRDAKRATDGDFDYADNSLRVEVWVDKGQDEIYRKGENIAVGVQTNQDAYAVVYRIDTEGLVTILWPRSRLDDGFIFGGHEYELPVAGADRLRVSSQEGEGIVEAIVSRYPFDLRALELDFHHERSAERYNFQVAGDPFLAMNEVNYAVTGLEDSGDYVVTNYTSYYVHQQVDHPRYLCSQCHLADDVSYDPYQDTCTLDIEYDYSWYNSWYDSYGYYPVYGNPVYVYIDPWTLNPWVNYWYQPVYTCAPWYGWGWGWGPCYSWGYSPYYWGNSWTAYNSGYTRYRPLDRTGQGATDGPVTKTREYTRGSAMVRQSKLSDRDRTAMTSRSKGGAGRQSPQIVAGRGVTRGTAYRGAAPEKRSRTRFDQVATRGQSSGGLRIREPISAGTTGRRVTTTPAQRKRHTAAGDGQRAGLVPVNRGSSFDNNNWRGTTRVGGSRGAGGTGSTVSNSRRSGTGSNQNTSATPNTRSRNASGGKAVQPRKRNTRVWTAPTSRSGSSGRTRSGTVNNRSSHYRDRSSGTNTRQAKPTRNTSSRRSSGDAVRKSSSSKSSNSGTRSRSGGSSSRSSRSGGSSRSTGRSHSGTSRR